MRISGDLNWLGLGSAVVSVLVLIGVTGCTPDDPIVLPVPAPSATPLFASDEEALAAAEEAYANYLAVSALVTAGGESELYRYREVATVEMAANLAETISRMTGDEIHTSGSSAFDRASLQQVFVDAEGATTVTIYLCLDVSNVRVLDVENIDVTPTNRDNRLPLEVDFSVESSSSPDLLVSRSDVWEGADFCEE